MNLVPINTISGYEGFIGYFVSDTGDIWSSRQKDTLVKMKAGKVKTNKAIWIYDINKRKKCILIGHLVAKAFIPNLTNSKRSAFISDDRMDCSVNNITWERQKKIKERTGIEKDIIMLDEIIVANFKQLYEAMKLKGYPVPTSTEFINQFLKEAMDNYISKYGLRKILYQMEQ